MKKWLLAGDMDKEFLIQITNKIYKLTILFPKKEPLRYKMREIADEILAKFLLISNLYQTIYKNKNCDKNNKDLIFAEFRKIYEKLEILDCFFEVAKEQNWVLPHKIVEIQKEYSNIKESLKKQEEEILSFITQSHLEESRPEIISGFLANPNKERTANLLTRKEKILEILKEKGRAQIWEFKEIFPEVTKRTLRRNFGQLVKQGLIERVGEKNQTFYKIKEQN